MKRTTETLTFATVLVLAVSLMAIGAAASPSLSARAKTMAKANAVCNAGIESDKRVTAKTLKACNTANVPTATKCASGPSVWLATILLPNSKQDTAELRLGHRPTVYTEANFYMSTIQQLCGEAIGSGLTPPPPPLTVGQVRALFRK